MPRVSPPGNPYLTFLLFLVAICVFILLAPLGVIYVLLFKRKQLHSYWWDSAITTNQAGNVINGPLFNLLLITRNSVHKFGNPDEMVSSVLGKNKREKTLTWTGMFFAWVLNRIDKNHVERAIEHDENIN